VGIDAPSLPSGASTIGPSAADGNATGLQGLYVENGEFSRLPGSDLSTFVLDFFDFFDALFAAFFESLDFLVFLAIWCTPPFGVPASWTML
jgi:hypothetical protein